MKVKESVAFTFDAGLVDSVTFIGDGYMLNGEWKPGKLIPDMIEIGTRAYTALKLEEQAGPAFLGWTLTGVTLWPHR